jgi:cell shape-determining protein MreC
MSHNFSVETPNDLRNEDIKENFRAKARRQSVANENERWTLKNCTSTSIMVRPFNSNVLMDEISSEDGWCKEHQEIMPSQLTPKTAQAETQC